MLRKAPQPDLVDLHVHSTVSDGLYPPHEVVRLAAEIGLRAVALTDHDTVAGVPEALAAGHVLGIEVIPGVEFSADFDDGACHILGYFLDHTHPPLLDLLHAAREGRHERNLKILARLNELGIPVTMEEVTRGAKEGVLTRGHFATVLIERKAAKNWDEAFAKYLGRGGLAYVSRRHVTPADAIQAVRGAGGLAALAHPRQLNRGADETDEWIERLAAAGLDAVETASPDHTPNYARRYKAVAERLGLLEVGGTDWHGRPEANVHLGLGAGAMAVHYDLVQRMKERLAARRAARG